jgi:SAM-dependent methyltransferase
MPVRHNQLDPQSWIPASTTALLDVGCNAGDLLADCTTLGSHIRLAGIDVNPNAVQQARLAVPSADIRHSSGSNLPFADATFDCVTFIEVIEHLPQELRPAACREIYRVLKPGGTLIIRCPHQGWFAWMDSNNLRFRFPAMYSRLVGHGMRDNGYKNRSHDVVWHHHFTRSELLHVVGPGFELLQERYGGLLLFPLGDIARWPFYRRRITRHPMLRAIDALMQWDAGVPYGSAAFTMLLVLRKTGKS